MNDRPTNLEQVSSVVSHVEGWLSDEQGRALYRAAAATTGRGAIVEIGSWKGRSTIWLASAARLTGRCVYAIDPHTRSNEDPLANTLAEFRANLERAGVSDAVRPLITTSAEAVAILEDPVELLFIDGDHSYDAVERDVELWLPRLIEGGVVLFHDVTTTAYSGPRRVFRRHVCLDSHFDSIRRVGSMTVARKTARRGFRGALWGTTAWLLLYLYDAKTVLRAARRALRA
jgi:predicted O-methyltransferase YrrM